MQGLGKRTGVGEEKLDDKDVKLIRDRKKGDSVSQDCQAPPEEGGMEISIKRHYEPKTLLKKKIKKSIVLLYSQTWYVVCE